MTELLQLQTSDVDGLIFAGSTLEARGKSGKTYTIEVAKNPNNLALLGDIWSVHELNYLKFDATMRTDFGDIPGVLILTEFDRMKARGNFVFGVGVVGSGLEGVMLRDLDFTDLDHTIAAINDDYFDGTEKFVYDAGSRGVFKTTDQFAVDELYPAYQVKELLRIILKDYAPDLSEVDDSVYWIFTEEYEIRNDPQWLRGIPAIASGTGYQRISESGTADGTFSFGDVIEYTAATGTQYNTTTHRYVNKETGTYEYRFRVNVTIQSTHPISTVGDSLKCEIKANGSTGFCSTTITSITYDGSLPYRAQITADVVAYLINQSADAYYEPYITFGGSIGGTGGGAWEIWLDYHFTEPVGWSGDFIPGQFIVSGSRYYGYGSTVSANDLLPDVAALDFVKMLLQGMNLVMYADAISKEIKIVNVENYGAQGELELRQVQQTIEPRKAFQLQFDDDEVVKLPDKITQEVSDYGDVYAVDIPFGRFAVGYNEPATRDEVPLLITDEERWITKMKPRLARLKGTDTSAKIEVQLFSTSAATHYQINVVPEWEELDYTTLFVTAITRGMRTVQGIGKFTTELLTIERYINPINLINEETGEYIGAGYIVKAEQQAGDVYIYTLII